MSLLFIGKAVSVLRFCPTHVHDVWEIVLNLEGSGVNTVGGVDYAFSKGNILCIPPNTEHMKRSEEGFLDIFMTCSYFPLANVAQNQPLTFEDDASESVGSIISLMYNLYHKKENNYQLVVNSLYEAAMQLIVGKKKSRIADEVIEHIKDCLVSSYSDPEINIDRVLSQSKYCQDYIRRRFKQVEGITPGEYLTALRISSAKKLLEQNALLHLPMGEIGLMCGYYDVHYFSRVFRQKTGKTPREYMNVHSGSGQAVSAMDQT